MSLFNQFSAAEARDIIKYVLSTLPMNMITLANYFFSVLNFSFLFVVMCSKTVLGGTPWWSSPTIRENIQALVCKFKRKKNLYIYSFLHRYQRLYFRNANHPIARPSITARRQDRTTMTDPSRTLEKDVDRRRACENDVCHSYSNQRTCRNSHIFDGQTLTKETAAFQLCDITDPMLKNMIENLDGLRDVCDVRLLLL